MKVLVVRFSAMGDVAMMVPVIRQVLKAHEELEITLISQMRFQSFFEDIPHLNFLGQDIQSLKGIPALFRFSNYLFELGPFYAMIDLHGSLRTRIISFFLGLRAIPIFRINKGKKEKNKAIRRKNKIVTPLPSTMNRYLEVFLRAGLNRDPCPIPDQIGEREFYQEKGIQISSLWTKKDEFYEPLRSIFPMKPKVIGWAPLAGYNLKEIPLGMQVFQVEAILKRIPEALVFLMASPREKNLLSAFWEKEEFKNRIFFSGDWANSLEEELALIQNLDLMVSMDSGNMHIAALLGVKVLGIYGPTHPDLGFIPYLQRKTGTYGLDTLSCRPCTVFGKGYCYRGDFACMNQINPDHLGQEILNRLA